MPSSHHEHDKTVLSCLVRVRSVNRIGDKSRLSVTENLEPVLSSLEVRCEQSFVLSRPSLLLATRTCLQTCSRRRQDWTQLFSLQYIVFTQDSLGITRLRVNLAERVPVIQ